MKVFAVLALASVAGTGVVSAGSSSAPMTVGVTVVRSCAIDASPATTEPGVRVTCSAGAQSNLRVTKAVQPEPSAATSDDRTILTLNF